MSDEVKSTQCVFVLCHGARLKMNAWLCGGTLVMMCTCICVTQGLEVCVHSTSPRVLIQASDPGLMILCTLVSHGAFPLKKLIQV